MKRAHRIVPLLAFAALFACSLSASAQPPEPARVDEKGNGAAKVRVFRGQTDDKVGFTRQHSGDSAEQEALLLSIEQGKSAVHRRFPKNEKAPVADEAIGKAERQRMQSLSRDERKAEVERKLADRAVAERLEAIRNRGRGRSR